LTTTGQDLFADMTYVSAAFLRHVHPECEIICLCDSPSHRGLADAKHLLLELVDHAQPVDTPDGPAGYRNRFVKTQMRQIVDGDFVYFDTDTLVVDRLDEMLACQRPMAGMPNASDRGDPTAIYACEREVFEVMGWQLPRRTYINGGVLFLRDCGPTRDFGRLWHEKWLARSCRGGYTDQQSLNSALADSGIDYEVLSNRFNAQIAERPSVCLDRVAVWHIYASQNDHAGLDVPKTILDEAIARFRDEGRLTPNVIGKLCRWPYPWRTPTVLDRWFVRHRVLSKDRLAWDSASRYWLAGNRRKAVMKYLRWRLLNQY
jgi:hypothetical protein